MNVKPAPFLKWPGGKRFILDRIAPHIPLEFNRYLEPFLGGGAVFFHLAPSRAILSDMDAELVNTFTCVRDHVDSVVDRLSLLEISRDVFYAIRSSEPSDSIDRAVRFIYLNRTAFNGIYRVNREGKFNVPFGCKPGTILCQEALLRASSKALQVAKLSVSDFSTVISSAQEGDLVYADPPYTTKHDDNGFRRYNRSLFSWDDQVRLAACVSEAVARRVKIVISNAHHRDLKRLYRNEFSAWTIWRTSCMSGTPANRGPVKEYLFVSRQ